MRKGLTKFTKQVGYEEVWFQTCAAASLRTKCLMLDFTVMLALISSSRALTAGNSWETQRNKAIKTFNRIQKTFRVILRLHNKWLKWLKMWGKKGEKKSPCQLHVSLRSPLNVKFAVVSDSEVEADSSNVKASFCCSYPSLTFTESMGVKSKL